MSRLRLGSHTALNGSFAALPPSKTTSGLSGQCRSQVTEVVLNGLRPPSAAMGEQPPASSAGAMSGWPRLTPVSSRHA